ncbi:nitrous oxide reductase family maturation protein NosD [uncultured Paracoccus sp.]|uniref:nitrous oxide reductase family maturation protein NosD n=1 Tax=uncultured Paracoccus sp. TaxID=189685 RepID=UPI00261DCC47|nr:nitrous oxide reductase family maturation protein NosD [uncultured Paracoccus sp.]
MHRTAAFLLLLVALMLPASGATAAERLVRPGAGELAAAVAAAAPGDVLILAPGQHQGPVVIDKPLTLDGRGEARIDGGGHGSVITITGEGAVVRGLVITGSGSEHETIDSGVQLTKTSSGAVIEGNRILGNLHGVDAHGSRDTVIRSNLIEGRQDRRMNDRGNGVYSWNTRGLVVQGNDIRMGRDGIYVVLSRDARFIENRFTRLRFAVHYMNTHDSEVSDNISVGNHLGFALMYSDRLMVRGNISLADRDHGLMLNYANSSDVTGNLVRGAAKCVFIYNAHKNLLAGNRFEGCGIGIHFTAGSERNGLSGNAFLGNREQVKYVGTRDVEWSVEEQGNYWSDHPAYDLNTDGIADARYRPNDLMDHILWSQPAAGLLTGSPAVQLIRWAQASFPAVLPGGVVDSHPQTRPVEIAVPAEIAEIAATTTPAWQNEQIDDFDPLAAH